MSLSNGHSTASPELLKAWEAFFTVGVAPAPTHADESRRIRALGRSGWPHGHLETYRGFRITHTNDGFMAYRDGQPASFSSKTAATHGGLPYARPEWALEDLLFAIDDHVDGAACARFGVA